MLSIATAILNLYAIPRHSQGETRINVGRIEAGSGRNVIADEGRMEIEVRDPQHRLTIMWRHMHGRF